MASSGKNESTPKEDTIPSLTKEAATLKEKLEEERRILHDVECKFCFMKALMMSNLKHKPNLACLFCLCAKCNRVGKYY